MASHVVIQEEECRTAFYHPTCYTPQALPKQTPGLHAFPARAWKEEKAWCLGDREVEAEEEEGNCVVWLCGCVSHCEDRPSEGGGGRRRKCDMTGEIGV